MHIKVANLTLGYDGKVVAKDINFSVDPGDYLCIVGENGTGKSTLLKALLNLHNPLSGEIKLEIERHEIGYLPQQDSIQKDFPASVWEIVLSGCVNRSVWRPFYNKAEKELAKTAMEKANITDLTKKCYRELSGGQQQRILLSRALVATQKIIVLDEPVAGLDPAAAAEMYKAINKINKDDGITVIMVSHDVDEAVKHASHILHLYNKKPHFFGTVKEYNK